MMLGGLLAMASSLWLAMDMDKTLVFYDNHPNPAEVQLLPASSGTNRVGFVGKETLVLLKALEGVLPNRLMCVSGQRAETMYQRQPFFPCINVWICENGGRKFHLAESSGLEEDLSFVERLFTSINPTIPYAEAAEKLSRLRAALLDQGFEVDARFKAMLRVKLPSPDVEGAAANRVIAQLPTQFLSYTFNLGYLDVTLRGITKASAIAAVMGAEENASVEQFIFMGDDDNDICAADAALEVYVSNPHSASMGRWLDRQKETIASGRFETRESASCLVFADERGLPRLVAVPASHLQGHHGAAALLQLILQRVSQ